MSNSTTPRAICVTVLVALLAGVLGLAAPQSASAARPGDFGRFGLPLALDSESPAAQELRRVQDTASPTTLNTLRTISRYPYVNWWGGNDPRVFDWVQYRVEDAARQGAVAQMVLFNLPHRGCERPTEEGPTSAAAYKRWVKRFVSALGKHRAIVIVEPDSLGLANCLPRPLKLQRYRLVAWAVHQLRLQGSWTYIDIGHSRWLPVRVAVNRLRAAGVREASGFSLNVSNFRPDAEIIKYGTAISKRIGGRHFVVDTSRNGILPGTGSWCNPPRTGIGHVPTARTGVKRVDAYLWIKGPGGSDDTCNGGPPSGQWFQRYADMLVRNARLHSS